MFWEQSGRIHRGFLARQVRNELKRIGSETAYRVQLVPQGEFRLHGELHRDENGQLRSRVELLESE